MKSQKRNLFFLLVLLFIIFAVGFVLKLFQFSKLDDSLIIPEPTPVVSIQERVTITGQIVCLPPKDTSGPQTLECAIGLQSDDGTYYALDTNLISQNPPEYTTGNIIKAVGNVTPIELLSTDHFMKYNVKGILMVESLEVIQ